MLNNICRAGRVNLIALPALSITANREQLLRAFENILRNALHYTAPGRGVDLELIKTGGGAEAIIRDYGSGVPESSLEHLFEAFYRVHEARDRESGGYGLGLAIAAAAVQRHGEPAARKTLKVRVVLPAQDSA